MGSNIAGNRASGSGAHTVFAKGYIYISWRLKQNARIHIPSAYDDVEVNKI